ncbi:MAG: DUF4838 domain-containing protein [Spirochaetota bacterium]
MKIISVLVTLAAAAVYSQTVFISPAPRNSANHKVSIDTSRTLTLAKDGVPGTVIVVPADATPTAKFAAQELKRYLTRAITADVPIMASIAPGKVNLLIGFNALSRTLPVKAPTLPRDSFIISHVNANGTDIILIAGNDDAEKDPADLVTKMNHWGQHFEKATLFAVYDLLERFLGVRFFFPDDAGIVVPAARTLLVNPMHIYEAPDFNVRWYSYLGSSFTSIDGKVPLPDGTDQNSPKGYHWANRERHYWRCQTEYIPNSHGLSRMGLVERFGKTNPDFFSLLPNGQRDISLDHNSGHLCLLNKGLEDEVTLDCLSYLKGEPPTVRNMYQERFKTAVWNLGAFQPGYVNIMPQDGFGERTRCRCPKCEEFFRTNGSYSDYVFGFVSRIADRVKASGVKGTVTTMAYSAYIDVPKIALPDNVLLQIAPMGPWVEKYPDKQAKDNAIIRAWNAKLGKPRSVYLWNYINDYGNQIPFGIPSFSVRKILSYYKSLSADITGAFLQSDTSYRLYNYLNWYSFFKVAWDNGTDAEALLADHHASMFGAGAAPMTKFYDMLESLWDSCIGEYKNTEMGPQFTPKSDADVWNTVFTEAKLAEMKVLFDEAENRAKSDAAALSRVKYMRDYLYGALVKYRSQMTGKKRELDDLTLTTVPAEGITVDGALSEAAWATESAFLVPYKKNENVKALTSVRTLWSSEGLYIGFECMEENIGDMIALARTNDDNNIWQDSGVEVFINPSGDRVRYGHIMVNAAGSFADEMVREKTHDWSWNSKTHYAVKRGGDRYTVELFVPLSMEGRSDLVINFNRSRVMKTTAKNQLQSWSPFLVQGFHDPERFGSLTLLKSRSDIVNDNILTNGSFEDTPDGAAKDWAMAKGFASIETGTFRHGKQCAKLSSTELITGTTRAVFYQYIPPLKPKTEYMISYYVKYENIELNPAASDSGGYMNVFGCPGNRFYPSKWYSGSSPWIKESHTFKTGDKPSDVNYVRIGFHNAKGTIWFDDVRLREIRK